MAGRDTSNREGNSAAFPRIFNDARNVPAIYPNGFLPLITTDIDDLAAAWGVRGTLGGWDTDVSIVYGTQRDALRRRETVSTPRTAPTRR